MSRMTQPLRLPKTDPRASRTKGVCKWPIGDPSEASFRFCEAASEPGRVYCAEHVAQAFAKPQRTPLLKTIGPSRRR